ncbi:MAG: trypsin-like serine protease [Bdellovibrionaceae bacterium]|nr:trypsin-like serine protease [Pseudobdellovibrionaceae bacterium]
MFSAILALAALFGVPTFAQAQNVAVCADKADCPGWFAHLKNHEGGNCSSFLLKPDIIATNRHCMPDDTTHAKVSCKGKITFHFPETDKYKKESRDCDEIVQISDKFGDEFIPLDIAILRLAKPVEREVADLAQTGLDDNVKFSIVKMDPDAKGGGKIRRVQCTAVQNSVINPYFQNNQSPIIHFQGCPIERGNSGSPMLNPEGKAIGIVSNLSVIMAPNSVRKEVEDKVEGTSGHGTNFSCLDTGFLGFNKGYDPSCKISLSEKFREDMRKKLLDQSAEPAWAAAEKLAMARLKEMADKSFVPFNVNIIDHRGPAKEDELKIRQSFEITPSCARWGSMMNVGAKRQRSVMKIKLPEVLTELDEHYRFKTTTTETETTIDVRWSFDQIKPGKYVTFDWYEWGRHAKRKRLHFRPCTPPKEL